MGAISLHPLVACAASVRTVLVWAGVGVVARWVGNKFGGVGWWRGVWVGFGGVVAGWVGCLVVVFGLVWLVVGCGGCWGWVFFVLFCLLFFGVFLLLFVCFGFGW